MFGIGMPELIIILVLALIVIGPHKLPDMARSLGKGLAEFKRASNDLRRNLEEETMVAEESNHAAEAGTAHAAAATEAAPEAAAVKS
jgi:sec-independent protein translocase protein TatA